MKRFFKSPAHLVILLWAGAWSQFLVTQALTWREAVNASVSWIALAVLFLLLALVPRRWESQGGALLLTCGLGLLLAYQQWPPMQLRPGLRVLLVLLLTLPPLTTGLIFLSPRGTTAKLQVSPQSR